MRVMCVQPIDNPSKDCISSPSPQVGDTVTVVDEFELFGQLFYVLAEYAQDEGFLADRFATLPDATADEMEEEEQFIYDQFSC